MSSSCSSGSISLSNFTRYNAPFGSSFAIGRVEACSNNVLVTVCDDTAYADYFAQQACSNLFSYSSKQCCYEHFFEIFFVIQIIVLFLMMIYMLMHCLIEV